MLTTVEPSTPLVVDDYVWVLDPNESMAGPIESGQRIQLLTAPGCWGPMITPDFPAGHEVTRPVAIKGAEVGDAVVIHIESIQVLSNATTSGVHVNDPNSMVGAVPFVGKKCPRCGRLNPKTFVEGVGKDAVRCIDCSAPVHACVMTAGYTMVFDENRTLGVTAGEGAARKVLHSPSEFLAMPANSKQHPANLLATGAMPGVVARVEPMIGNIGTMPACRVPSCQNSGDIAPRLVNDAHPLKLEAEDLEGISDGHLDDNLVMEGTTLVYPVHVAGAGVYVGDIHAMQSDGEVAGHTTDVTAQVMLRVELIKGVDLPGPLLLPPPHRVPEMIRPLSTIEVSAAKALAHEMGQEAEVDALPLIAVGAAPDIRTAVENAMGRLAKLTRLSYDEVRNRVTISGCVEIARLTGTVHVGMRFPPSRIANEPLRNTLVQKYSPKLT